MKAFWNTPLGKDIIIVLVIKLLAVFAIWWFFFRSVGEQQPVDATQMSVSMLGKQQDVVKPIVNLPSADREPLK